MCVLKRRLISWLAKKKGFILLRGNPTSESSESHLPFAQMDTGQSRGRGLLSGGGGGDGGGSRLKAHQQTDGRKQDVVGCGGNVTA